MSKKDKKMTTPAVKEALAKFKYELSAEWLGAKDERYFRHQQSFGEQSLGAYMVSQILQAQENKMNKE